MIELERSVCSYYRSVATVSTSCDEFSRGEVELGSAVQAFDFRNDLGRD